MAWLHLKITSPILATCVHKMLLQFWEVLHGVGLTLPTLLSPKLVSDTSIIKNNVACNKLEIVLRDREVETLFKMRNRDKFLPYSMLDKS